MTDDELEMIIKYYDGEPHRFYHNSSHIFNMLNNNPYDKDSEEYNIYKDAVIFHDIVYDPRRSDNELESIRFYEEYQKKHGYPISDIVVNIIRYSDPKTYDKNLPLQYTQQIIDFRKRDLWAFYTCDTIALISNFKKLLKEFQFASYREFKFGHLRFIEGLIKLGWFDNAFLSKYIEYVQAYVPSIGIYAGSFNPFHIGHASVLEQAEKLFDKVIVAYPSNTQMDSYSPEEVLPFHEVYAFDGLLIDYINKIRSYSHVTLIRGLRNGNDLEYEINMKSINDDLQNAHAFDTAYFITNYPHVSSTVVRTLDTDIYKPTKYNYDYDG